MKEHRFWNEQIETMGKEELEELQLSKLKKQLKYCFDSSGYHREKFAQAGVLPDDIKTLDDFRRLPIFVTKDDQRRCQEESLQKYGHPFGDLLCASPKEVVRVGSTSGTTGTPTYYAFTRHDVEVTNEALCRLFWRAGIRPGDRVIVGGGISMWGAGISWIEALRSFGACVFPVGAEAGTARILQYINLVRPFAVEGTPSLFEHLIERAPEVTGKKVHEFGIGKLLCIGEAGAGLPEIRKKLIDSYQAEVYDTTGGVWGNATLSCFPKEYEYRGMHILAPDNYLKTDIINPLTKEPIPIENGAVGEGLVTSLEFEALPALRYKFGDMIQVFTDECECGMPGVRIKILERVDDMFVVKGVNVYPTAVKNLISSFTNKVTGELLIILDGPPIRVAAPVKIKVEVTNQVKREDFANLKVEIERKIRDLLRFLADVELVSQGTLRSETFKKKLVQKKEEL